MLYASNHVLARDGSAVTMKGVRVRIGVGVGGISFLLLLLLPFLLSLSLGCDDMRTLRLPSISLHLSPSLLRVIPCKSLSTSTRRPSGSSSLYCTPPALLLLTLPTTATPNPASASLSLID